MEAITFENLGLSQEMLKALEKKAFEQPLNEHLRKQMTYIHSAKITTIDSFCADVVREHFSEIDLDPAFKVGDTGELTLLKSDVVAKVLEDNYLRGEEGFLKFIDIYSGSKLFKLQKVYLTQNGSTVEIDGSTYRKYMIYEFFYGSWRRS